mmetsp:Transcript_41264/g.97888  ORF Transcript_41264/g.97888 Transcript_41264/m.97888 type:complete len:139 (-) Transcript_41264:46-462(-)
MFPGRIFGTVTSHTTAGLFAVRQALNTVTGYDRIEVLLKQVSETQKALTEATSEAKLAKKHYENRVENRSSLQNEIILLLQRKSSWVATDTSAFANLVQRELEASQEESAAKKHFQDAEARAQAALDAMTKTSLTSGR